MNFDSTLELHYRTFRRFLVNVAAKRLSNNYHVAEEAVQESYTKAYQYKDGFNLEKDFNKWFRTIFNNVVKDFGRIERSQGAVEITEEVVDEEATQKDHSLSKYINEYTDSERDREILNLRYVVGMPIKDIKFFTTASYDNCRKICNLFKKSLEE